MATRTGICNIALSHISAKNTLSDLDLDKTTEAKTLRIFYDSALEFVLADIEWNFCKARVTLAELSETVDDWDYVYSYPNKAVKLRGIYKSTHRSDVKELPFATGLNEDLTKRVILTDVYQAKAEITAKVTDTNLFPPAFVMMFAQYLAYLIAMPLTKKRSMRDDMMKEYNRMKLIADVTDIEEATEDDLIQSEFLSSRN